MDTSIRKIGGLSAGGRKLHVVDDEEMNDDLIQDMVDVMTFFVLDFTEGVVQRTELKGH